MDVAIHMSMPSGVVETPFGTFNVQPGLHAAILIPMLQKIADAINQQFLGRKTFYCNPLPLVPWEWGPVSPFNTRLRPQFDADLMAIVVALHQLADGLDVGFSAPTAILNSPVSELPPDLAPIPPTTLSDALQAKLAALQSRTGVGFLFFAHPSPLKNGGDPILQFPQLKLYEVSGGICRVDSYDDLARALEATLASGGIVVGMGAQDEYHVDASAQTVPNGYHVEPATTTHPTDNSRPWLATDFEQLVPDAPPAATT